MKKEKQISEIDLLLIKCLSGEASGQEHINAIEWIRSSDENAAYYDNLRDVWISLSIETPVDSKQMEKVWGKVKSRTFSHAEAISKPQRIWTLSGTQQLIRYAAVAFVFMAIGAVMFYLMSPKISQPQNLTYVVEAPLGAKAKVTLPDGTLVNLNAGSKLSYTSLYNFKDRTVTLSGEAFFKVAKDKAKPFTVNTMALNVRALGTSFNVKAYPQDDIIETTLVEGSVKIESNDSKKSKMVLKPNEKLTFTKSNNRIDISELRNETEKIPEEKKEIPKSIQNLKSIESITSWKDNRLVFDNENLDEMVSKMQRWYGVQIQLKSVDSVMARYSGKFIYNETIYQVLDILSRTTPIHYETKDHVIYIYSN